MNRGVMKYGVEPGTRDPLGLPKYRLSTLSPAMSVAVIRLSKMTLSMTIKL